MQVKNDQDVRFIRVWAVTAVTPVARVVEWLRGGSIGFLQQLHPAARHQRRRTAGCATKLDRLKMENMFLKNELNTADRAKALQVFQAHTPSKMLAATHHRHRRRRRIRKVVFVDRGSRRRRDAGHGGGHAGRHRGQGDRRVSDRLQVLLITDPDFAAGVISQKSQVRGTLKGQGTPHVQGGLRAVRGEGRSRANGSTPRATTASSRAAFPWACARCAPGSRSRRFWSSRAACSTAWRTC